MKSAIRTSTDFVGADLVGAAALNVKLTRAVASGTQLIAITLLLFCALAQPVAADCTFFSEPQRYNTQTADGVVVIGEQRDRPYKVIVISEDVVVLSSIQACILDAFATDSSLGSFIQVASFNRRQEAESLRRILAREGYDARVNYQR